MLIFKPHLIRWLAIHYTIMTGIPKFCPKIIKPLLNWSTLWNMIQYANENSVWVKVLCISDICWFRRQKYLMTFEQNLEVTVILYFERSILYSCGETLERLKLIKKEFCLIFSGGYNWNYSPNSFYFVNLHSVHHRNKGLIESFTKETPKKKTNKQLITLLLLLMTN